MSEIDPMDHTDYEDEAAGKTKRREEKRRRKKRPHTFTGSDRQQKRTDIATLRQDRADTAEAHIGKVLAHFPDIRSEEGLSQSSAYIRWVTSALLTADPVIAADDLTLRNVLSSVKAGGQHQQKNRTAVIATHLPTGIRVRNEEERSASANRERALTNLTEALKQHLEFWRTIEDIDPQMSVDETVIDLLKKRSG